MKGFSNLVPVINDQRTLSRITSLILEWRVPNKRELSCMSIFRKGNVIVPLSNLRQTQSATLAAGPGPVEIESGQ